MIPRVFWPRERTKLVVIREGSLRTRHVYSHGFAAPPARVNGMIVNGQFSCFDAILHDDLNTFGFPTQLYWRSTKQASYVAIT